MKRFLLRKQHFLRYCFFGGCGTVLTCASYALLVKYAGLHYQVANAIGYALGTTLSFILNMRLNFKTGDRPAARFLSFVAVAVMGWVVSAGLLQLFIGRLGLDAYSAFLIVILGVLLLQYNLNRLVSFRHSKPDHA